ncbi:MAG: response regulator transcription factor [Spirosomataceae bacterium]
MSHKILLVEDDDSLGFVVKDNLEMSGYAVNWQKNGKAGKTTFGQNAFDLCILDVMLPEMDGFTLAEHIRQSGSEVPIIFLTAKSLKEDRIQGFKIGGDDYLTKPFSIEELVLRIEVILKRSGKKNGQATTTQAVGQYQFDSKNLKLSHSDGDSELTQREAELLKLLLQHKNNVVSREKILIDLWGEDDYFKGRSLDVFITRLRKYLSHDPTIKLVNVHGVGFRLEC